MVNGSILPMTTSCRRDHLQVRDPTVGHPINRKRTPPPHPISHIVALALWAMVVRFTSPLAPKVGCCKNTRLMHGKGHTPRCELNKIYPRQQREAGATSATAMDLPGIDPALV